MIERVVVQIPRRVTWLVAAVGLAIAPALPACASSSVMSGVAVGKVGHGLSTSAQTVPQGAEVCALQDALATPAAAQKPTSETCAKATKSDQLWRRAMMVLAAHADRLDALASGAKPETAGQLDAALTGVRGPDCIQVDDPQEQAARDAVTQLVTQMSAGDPKADLGKAVQEAAPRVRTICDGLTAYLDKQVQGVTDVANEVEKRRAGRTNNRCGKVGDQVVCESESFLDRIVYADLFGKAAAVQSSHMQARDTVAAFCAAHQKLAEAGANGQLQKDQTYLDIVAAVKAAPSSSQPASPTPAATASGSPPAAPEKK